VKDCVQLQRSYSFPALYPQQLLPQVLSAVVGYGSPLIISPEGGVIMSGVVQTIITEESVNGETGTLISHHDLHVQSSR
jgi:hypothetical protein